MNERPRTKEEVIEEFTRAAGENSTYTLEMERPGIGSEVLQVLALAMSAYNGSLASRGEESITATGTTLQ